MTGVTSYSRGYGVTAMTTKGCSISASQGIAATSFMAARSSSAAITGARTVRANTAPLPKGQAAASVARTFRTFARQIFDINKRRLERANFLFGYVESIDAYGTILEIGMASTLQIPIALRLPADPDLWMTFHAATKLYDGTAAECWQKFQHDFISQFYTPVVR